MPGARTQAVATYDYKNALAQRQVLDVASTAFERKYQNALTSPYHVQIATDVYNLGVRESGLGDDSAWGDIVKTFVGEVGRGIGGRISGDNPYITQAAPAAPATETPGWVKAAVIGGGALLGGILLLSVVRR